MLLIGLCACPTLELGSVGLKAGSVKGGSFTLTAQFLVKETDDTNAEGASPQEGRGMVAILLPTGWTVADARVKSPFEDSVRRLISVPQVGPAFAQTFPKDEGAWWTYASNEVAIPTGDYVFDIEIDVVAGKKAKGGIIGVAVAQLSEDLSQLPAPKKFEISLKGKGSIKGIGTALDLGTPPPPPETKGGNDKASGG
jgi:hypothetical protein